jgi:hypothetical protein
MHHPARGEQRCLVTSRSTRTQLEALLVNRASLNARLRANAEAIRLVLTIAADTMEESGALEDHRNAK